MQKKFNFLFSGDMLADARHLFLYIEHYCRVLGMEACNVETNCVSRVISAMYQDFPHPIGPNDASPFKKAAAFTVNFVAEKPIFSSFPEDKFGKLATHQNAIIAYALSIDALHGANLKRQDGTEVVLENRIQVSTHYWKEFIRGLAGVKPVDHFDCVALIYEALAYQVNPDAAYSEKI